MPTHYTICIHNVMIQLLLAHCQRRVLTETSIRGKHRLRASHLTTIPNKYDPKRHIIMHLLIAPLLPGRHLATAALNTWVRKKPPLVRSMTCWYTELLG